MKILVTGRSGQLARSLVERAPNVPGVDLVAVGRPEIDITDRASVRDCMSAVRPEIVISAAAYTAVDLAEDEPELAFAVNVTGAANVAQAAEKAGAAVIHLSTDYVFSGHEPNPYSEDSRTEPCSIYGCSKLEGEHQVRCCNDRHVIVRTSWVYSPFGGNFLQTILGLAQRQNVIRVVSDQWGNPTSAIDLADNLLAIATSLQDERFGTYHLAGSGETNRSDFARHIMYASRLAGGPFADIVDISSNDYPARAPRPSNSRLCIDKAKDVFGLQPQDWRSSIRRDVARLLKESVHG